MPLSFFYPGGMFQSKPKASPYGSGLPINRFGYGQPLPTEPTQPDNTDDFMAKYNEITRDRSQRLAYQQAVNEGPEQIHRGKWAILGGALTAAGANLGGESPTNAAKLAMSAYDRPQDRADQDYKERILRLGQSANMEQQDIEDKLKALEFSRGEMWKGKDYGLRVDEGKRSQAQLDLQGQSTRKQIERIDQEMEDANLYDHTDPETGWTVVKDRRTGKIVSIKGQTKLSPDQEAAAEGKKAGAKAAAEAPYRLAEIDKGNQAKLDLQKQKDDANMARVQAKLDRAIGTMKPADKYRQALLDIKAASSTDKNLNIPGLYDLDPMGMPIVDEHHMWDSTEETNAKNKLSDIIAKSFTKAASGGGGNTTPAAGGTGKPLTLPEGFSISTPTPSVTPSPSPSAIPTPRITPTPTPSPINTSTPPLNISGNTPPDMFGQGIQLPPPPSQPPPNMAPAASRFMPDIPPNIPPASTRFMPNSNLMSTPVTRPTPPPPAPLPNTNVPPPPNAPITGNPLAGLPGPRVGPPESIAPRLAPSPSPMPSPAGGPTPTLPAPKIPPEVEFNSIMGNVVKRFEDTTGVSLKEISGKRTADEQAKLYAQGRTTGKKGEIVTQADGTKVLSKHQTGEAGDFTFVDKKGKPVKPTRQLYETFGRIAKQQGLVWGGDWKSPYDPGHVQLGSTLTRQ